MIDCDDVVIVGVPPFCSDKQALQTAYDESVRVFRKLSADLGALPDSASPQRYFPLVVALRNAIRDANQAYENCQQRATERRC
jgi:hypothetical protein